MLKYVEVNWRLITVEMLDAIKKMLNDNGEIYFDTTVGWYEGSKDYRTGGQDIIYIKENNIIYKKYDEVILPGNVEKKQIEISLEEIKKELEAFDVKVEEVLSAAIINRSQWECKG
jgi:tRNA G46 methylase TrmB